MLSVLGVMTAAGGLFLFLWYRTLAGLPLKQQPHFVRPFVFKWSVPSVSMLLFGTGILMLWEVSAAWALIVLLTAAVAGLLIIRFDRYSANMRLICDHYHQVREANPGMEEVEALFLTAAWRYPKWSHDRLVELVASKNLEQLVLMMIINDFDINPISDWELYRNLKSKAARTVHSGR